MIQGEAGSITKLAAIFFNKEIKTLGLSNDIYITNLIHDEINVETKIEHAQLASDILEKSMKKSADIWCKRVPLNAEAKIVDYWTH